ncbi:hypothetical protein OC845_002216 [Tilletia horrida]|nr:hypothetical protein OC845_002216 [Tilletia horrida]
MLGSPPNSYHTPLHPGSREALAQKATLQPADGAALQLDLAALLGRQCPTTRARPRLNSLKPVSPGQIPCKERINTPTASKAAHFVSVLEHIKVFKQKQRPTAVSRDDSPEYTETETEGEREFPFYQNWRKHAASVSSPGGASNGSAASTQLEFWDNNENNNYQLDFRKRPALETVASSLKSRPSSPSSVGRTHSREVHSSKSTSAEFNSSRKVHSPKSFQIEELSRSLERLRSDEDAELGDERAPLPVRSKRRSPPASPGSVNRRSSSPSTWTARYDFDPSLNNPKTGSRTTNAGRQAALDYFSAKPPPPSTALGRPISSAALHRCHLRSITPVALRSADSTLAVPVGVFAPKVGMISPGLGDVIAHLPTSVNTGSATPSPSSGFNSAANSLAAELSTGVVEMGTVEQPAVVAVVTRSTPEARTSASTKFRSYPVNRHTLSPMAGAQLYRNPRVLEERVPSPLSRQSTATSNSGRESPLKKDRSNVVLLTSSFVGDSPQHSPDSPLHSPNPFSPSLSVSSLESDNTTCLASPKDTVLGSSLGSSRRSTDIRTPGSVEDIHRSLLTMGRVGLPNGNGAPSTPAGNSSHATPGSPSLSTASTSDSASSSSSMRPGSVSSYDELIARFCWNDSSDSQGDTTVTSAPASSGVPEPSAALLSNGRASSPTSENLQRLPHHAFANSKGNATAESGSATLTIHV